MVDTLVIAPSLDGLTNEFEPKKWVRNNRQFIVGSLAIKNMYVWTNGRVSFEFSPPSKKEVPVSVEQS